MSTSTARCGKSAWRAIAAVGCVLLTVGVVCLVILNWGQEDEAAQRVVSPDNNTSVRVHVPPVPMGEARSLEGRGDAEHSEATVTPVEAVSDLNEGWASINVSVVWRSSEQPAESVPVWVQSMAGREAGRGRVSLVTDSSGRVTFKKVPPGRFVVSTQDSPGVVGVGLAGESVEVSLIVPEGLRVHVLVLTQEGSVAPDSEVWLSHTQNSPDGDIVGVTDVRGELELRGLPANRWIQAISEDYCPSNRVLLDDQVGGVVKCVLHLGPLGGVISGLIVDTQGRGVAGAEVSALPIESLVVRRDEIAPSASRVPIKRTKSLGDGSFQLDGLVAGSTLVNVRADGYIADTETTVYVRSGEKTQCQIVLQSGCVLWGTVLDTDGIMVSGATVKVGRRGLVGEVAYVTGVDGMFVLDELPAGTVEIRVEGQDFVTATGVAEVTNARPTVWNVVVERGLAIGGVVNSAERGIALTDWVVVLKPEGEGRSSYVITDERGHFEFNGCERKPYTLIVWNDLSLRGPPRAEMRGVYPGSSLVTLFASEIEVLTVTVTGQLRTVDNRVPAPHVVSMQCVSTKEVVSTKSNESDGSFEFRLVPEGRYAVIVRDGARIVSIGWATVVAGSDHDLGTVSIETPSVLRVIITSGLACVYPIDVIIEAVGGVEVLRVECAEEVSALNCRVPQGQYHVRIVDKAGCKVVKNVDVPRHGEVLVEF